MNLKQVSKWFLLICSLLFTLSACLPAEDAPVAVPVKASGAAAYNLGAVTRGTLVQTKRVTVDYRPLSENNYSFTLDGIFYDGISAAAGDIVEEGEVLARLDKSAVNGRVANAEFDLRLAQAAADMYAGTDSAEASRKRRNLAQEKLDAVRSEAELYELRAVSGGLVTFAKSVTPQKVSRKGEIIFTVANGEPQYRVGSADSGYFTAGESYTLNLDGSEYTAIAREEGGAIYFTPELDVETPPARGSIVLTLERSDNALIVPGKAVKRGSDGGDVVYVLNSAGLREAITVETGLTVGGNTEIKNGLNEGDEIIVG
ncbi:MAG: hypothetical protein LBN97_08965 [Oscillospiraceae bacterium]|nr:hypothetical protein [Oscillospiraceae bacterium]